MEKIDSELNNISKEVKKEKGERGKKTMGKKKKEIKEDESNEKSKFFIDVSKEIETRDLIGKHLSEANNKSFGREIILKDLVIASLPKLNQKDIERIQENALTDMEKIERLLVEHNEKNKTTLNLGEFLVRRLNI
jgi:hypothetical protein